MPLTVATNERALRATAALSQSDREVNASMQKLSTGKRINSASDDAAGLVIANRMTSQIRGLNTALGNTLDAINLLNTADGALQEISAMFQRMRELAVQAANGTLSDTDRGALNSEFSAIREEITRVKQTTTWNGKNLLDGTFSADMQVGSNSGQLKNVFLDETSMPTINGPIVLSGSGTLFVTPLFTQNYTTLIEVDTTSFTSGGTIDIIVQLGNGTSRSSYDLYKNTVTYGGAQNRPINSLANAYDVAQGTTTNLTYNFSASPTDKYYFGIEGNWFSPAGSTNTFNYTITVTGPGSPSQPANIITQSNASNSIAAIDASINSTDNLRSKIGSQLSAFASIANNTAQANTNLTASRSRILDADYAAETIALSKNLIISNAASAMLAQANQQPKIVLDLLQSLA